MPADVYTVLHRAPAGGMRCGPQSPGHYAADVAMEGKACLSGIRHAAGMRHWRGTAPLADMNVIFGPRSTAPVSGQSAGLVPGGSGPDSRRIPAGERRSPARVAAGSRPTAVAAEGVSAAWGTFSRSRRRSVSPQQRFSASRAQPGDP